MNTAVTIFQNPSFGSLRAFTDHDGEPLFVARDVAEALGYSESSNPARLLAHVPEEWKGVKRIHAAARRHATEAIRASDTV